MAEIAGVHRNTIVQAQTVTAQAAPAVVDAACSPAYAEPSDRGTIAPKPKGPVCEYTTICSGCSPHRQAGFCRAQVSPMPEIRLRIGFGRDGRSGNARRTASDVF